MPGARNPEIDNRSYTRRNILILLGVLAVPTVLVLALVAYFAGSRSHMTLGGGSIWDSSLLADDGSSNSAATWLSVADTGSIESGALAEHLAQAVPQLGGTSGIFQRESTHSTRASDERMGSVRVSARGADEYETEAPWVEATYYLYGEGGSGQQALLADMASWEPLDGPDLESVSYVEETQVDTETIQVFVFGPLNETQVWSYSAAPVAQWMPPPRPTTSRAAGTSIHQEPQNKPPTAKAPASLSGSRGRASALAVSELRTRAGGL